MRILVVEDNVFISLMIEDELRDAGYDVLPAVASSGDARKAFEAQPCDLAFVDLDLTDGRTGGDFARWVAAESDCRVIFATGQSVLADEWGDAAIGVLEKPTLPAALVAAARAVEAMEDGRAPKWPSALRLFGHPGQGAGAQSSENRV